MIEMNFDNTAYSRGVDKGKLEGKLEGRLEGELKGKLKGDYERAIRTAEKMLLKNKPIEEIIDFTELTEEQITELKTNLSL
jgi:predicted transposase YdaD